MKPIVGVTALYDEDRSSVWMLPGYLDAVSQAGGVPVILSLRAEDPDVDVLFRHLDGLLLTGGHDVDPSLYGEEPAGAGPVCPARDAVERKYFDKAMSVDLPVFGICRGLQFINAVLGGTLYQDIPSQFGNDICHGRPAPGGVCTHKANVLKNTPLYALFDTEKIVVNSYHHQGVRTLAPGLRPCAIAEDGLVEAIFAPHKTYVRAVQWHPELNFETDEHSKKLFRDFIQACAQGKK